MTQRANTNTSTIALEKDDKQRMSASYLYKHSYKVSTKLPRAVVKNREFDPNLPKVDPLVTRQLTMIKNRDTKSPFLTERQTGP